VFFRHLNRRDRRAGLTRCFAGNGRLAVSTLSPNATHSGGYAELDVHNLWGLMEAEATHKALQAILPGQRPFIISRSTFASAGKWTGHWASAVILATFEFF
jgi:alpha-glucosidase (family GH31 glycosyl hydrolase)